MKRALFRADSGPGVGDGHLMRCLALAQGFAREGTAPILLADTPLTRAGAAWTSSGFEILPAVDTAGDPGTRALIAAAGERGASCIILDGYRFGPEMFGALEQARLPVVRFDDTGEVDVPCELVINQNPGADTRFAQSYTRALKALLGPRYACIREEIRTLKPVGGAGILICFGGSVDASVGAVIARRIHSRQPQVQVTLVAPGATSALSSSDRFAAHEWSDLVPFFKTADLVVCGAGVTALETAYLGLQAVFMPVAANQLPGADALRRAGAAVVNSSNDAADCAVALVESAGQGRGLAARPRLVDGQGPERIHAELTKIIG